MRRIMLVCVAVLCSQFVAGQVSTGFGRKKVTYEEVDLENVMKRYFGKTFGHSIEGIYSVSCVITKRKKKFLSNGERVRVMARRDNYGKVAIMKDWPNSNRDFIEISLSYRKTNSFPIMGELDVMANGAGYVYTHIEPDGKRYIFSMLESEGMLEAEHSVTKRRRTVTYHLSYMKIYPTEEPEVTVHGTP